MMIVYFLREKIYIDQLREILNLSYPGIVGDDS